MCHRDLVRWSEQMPLSLLLTFLLMVTPSLWLGNPALDLTMVSEFNTV